MTPASACSGTPPGPTTETSSSVPWRWQVTPIPDQPGAVDDVGGRHGQPPAPVGGVVWQVGAEYCADDVLQIGRSGVLQLVGLDHFLVHVAEDLEAEPGLAGERKGMVWGLRADGQERCAPGTDVREGVLEGSQLGVAERAPLAPVEDKHGRAGGQPLG